jgi:hypothetical protein
MDDIEWRYDRSFDRCIRFTSKRIEFYSTYNRLGETRRFIKSPRFISRKISILISISIFSLFTYLNPLSLYSPLYVISLSVMGLLCIAIYSMISSRIFCFNRDGDRGFLDITRFMNGVVLVSDEGIVVCKGEGSPEECDIFGMSHCDMEDVEVSSGRFLSRLECGDSVFYLKGDLEPILNDTRNLVEAIHREKVAGEVTKKL